ncbi:MAG TPA: 2-oxo acid dehydrogenase subunit E2 [Methylomirabilota bacterium]|nr:2-oxo acid dehydrogenase subunit E2 [Methylomirabilota bacterium]
MDVKLPKLGESAEGGVVVSVLVAEGDQVAQGQTILELENEKAVAPIPAPAAGTVGKIRVKAGDRVTVGQVILTLNETGAASAEPVVATAVPRKPAPGAVRPVPAAVEPEPDAEAEGGEEAPAEGPMPAAAPSIRKLARDLGLDLRRIRGSERGGRIVLADVRAYIQRLQKLAAAPKPSPTAPTARPVESIDFSQWGPVSRQPLSPLRKVISRRMAESWNAVPRVTQFDEVDITTLMDLRKKFAPEYEKKGARLTLTSFALKAAAITLKKHPIFNASLDEASGEVVLKHYYHLGLAVDTEQGLLVPVIRDVDRKSLFELSREVSTLADKARERKLTAEEMKGGTFTISNQGGIGGAHFTPIVNVPEVAILGLGKGALKPQVREGRIEPRLMLPIAIAYDHRLIDGGTAARFTVDLAQALTAFTEADLKSG